MNVGGIFDDQTLANAFLVLPISDHRLESSLTEVATVKWIISMTGLLLKHIKAGQSVQTLLEY